MVLFIHRRYIIMQHKTFSLNPVKASISFILGRQCNSVRKENRHAEKYRKWD